MTRHRTRVRLSRSLRVVAVALLAIASATVLFEADIGRSLLLSSMLVAGAPPLLYVLLAFVLLRGAPLDRRLGWAIGACGIYAALGVASGVTLSLVHPMSLEGALRRSLWSFAPAPIVHLLAAPLMLLAWRSRVTPGRLIGRGEREAFTLFPRRSAASSPDWDSVLHVSAPAPKAHGSTPPVPERAGRERDTIPVARTPQERTPTAIVAGVPDAIAPLVATPPAPAPVPAASPMVAAPSSKPAPPRPVVSTPASRPAATAAPAPTSPPPPPASARGKTTPKPAAIEEPVTGEPEPVIRIPFDRVADQLPPDVFTLPPARLAESLPEPHVLLVPRRLVLPQLAEGAVEIAWTLVDGQFPELAFAMPQAEVRRRFPGWVLSLPMDVVVRQIPPDLIRVAGPAPDLTPIGEFPAPFTPGPPEPESAAPSQSRPAADSKPAVALSPPVAPPPASKRETPPTRGPRAASSGPVTAPPVPTPAALRQDGPIDIPEVLFAPEPSPPQAAPPVAPPMPKTPPPPAPPTPPAVAAPAPARTAPAAPRTAVAAGPAGASGSNVVATATRAPVRDEESEALAKTLALGLAPLGAFDWYTRRIGGRPLVTLIPPALIREPIERLAAGAAALVQRLESWRMEQMTIRTARLACVLTPLGARGCLAATVRRGGSVAMLELLSARAARATGEIASASASPIAFPTVGTVPAAEDAGHRNVAEATRALAAFGSIAASVVEADGTAPGVYVFAGHDQSVLAGAARAVYDALVPALDQDALGRLESVVLRRGRERVVVRPLDGRTGTPAVLATAGEVVMAGRAHRAAAQAAAVLETR